MLFRSGIVASASALFNFDSSREPIASRSKNLSRQCSVFQSEIYGLILSTQLIWEYIQEHGPIDSVILYTDSQAAIKALSSIYFTSKITKSCRYALHNLGMLCKVTVKWVKAHVGYHGNELADKLAKEQVERPGDPFDGVLPPPNVVYGHIEEYFRTLWSGFWNTVPYSQSKFWFREVNPSRAKSILKHVRKEVTLLGRWLSGFAFLRRQNELVTPGSHFTITCRLCDSAPERAIHILTECGPLLTLRRDSFGVPLITDPPTDWTPGQVLHFILDERVERLEAEESANQSDWIDLLSNPMAPSSNPIPDSNSDSTDSSFELLDLTPNGVKEQLDYHPFQLSHFHQISSSEDD